MNSRALLASFALGVSSVALAIPVTYVERPGAIAVRVDVDYGLLDSCDAREIPHIVEHLVLSNTSYGPTPADLFAGLMAQGIRATAITRQDGTEFVFEGSAGTGPAIQAAIIETLGRPTLPMESAVREIEAIRLEVGGVPGFFSQTHAFETWAYEHIPGAQPPCPSNQTPVEKFSHAKISAAFANFYGDGTYRLTVVAPAGEFDADSLARNLSAARPSTTPPRRSSNELEGQSALASKANVANSEQAAVEILIGIPGRNAMPAAKARQAAEDVRLALQARLRRHPNAYVAKAVVHQSNRAGWISVSAPLFGSTAQDMGSELRSVALTAYQSSLKRPLFLELLSNRELAENLVTPAAMGVSDATLPASPAFIEVIFTAREPDHRRLRLVTIGTLGFIICLMLCSRFLPTRIRYQFPWFKRQSSG